ncbi:S-layer homology domain-containing protein [Caryophanon latum]|uniref:SLH domain-containing protein n=1 Tax=Caryophanon latum TaxID=33977 RepID=A0A1C0YUA1_9BACL|nr:S-layer homology domain-containing protein [Caryophanon latum]OCS90733.1 hypothetical protein A6K76_01390 [Caryophanon latum]
MYKNNVLGNDRSSFNPKHAMTRQDFAVMMVKALGHSEVAPVNTQFKDVTKSNASSGYIQIAVNKGIIKGYEDGTFRPNTTLNRGHAATFLSRAYNFKAGSKTFKDVGKSHTAYSAVQQLVQANVANGYEDGTFRPNNTLTRAHAAAFLARTMKYFSGEKFPLTEADVLKRLKQKGYWPDGLYAHVDGWQSEGVYRVQVYQDTPFQTFTYDWYEVDQHTGLIEPMFGDKIKHNLTQDQARRLLFNEGYLPKNATLDQSFISGSSYFFRYFLPLQQTSMTFIVDRYTSEVEMDM